MINILIPRTGTTTMNPMPVNLYASYRLMISTFIDLQQYLLQKHYKVISSVYRQSAYTFRSSEDCSEDCSEDYSEDYYVLDEKIDLITALRVFHKVYEQGQVRDGKRTLSGLTACTDFDGYTAMLSDRHVTLTIYFHNKYHIDFTNRLALKDFIDLIKRVDRS